MTFGQRLTELRKAKGLSQRALANKVGINFRYLSKLETGVMPHPGEGIILSLAKALEADTDELFNLAGKIPPDLINKLNIETIKGLRAFQEQHRRISDPSSSEIDHTKLGKTQEEQEKFYQAIIDNSLDGVVVMSNDMEVIYQNSSAARILGYGSGEFNRVDVLKLIHPNDMSEVAQLFKRLTEKPDDSMRTETRIKHKDGTWRIIESIGVNLLHNYSLKGIVITFRDITKRGQEKYLPEHVAVEMGKEYKLTESEHKVLLMMTEGLANHQIAERLVLSSSTVRFHVSNILSKLGVTNRTKAVALATKCHLVE